jgi:hypothetical protein
MKVKGHQGESSKFITYRERTLLLIEKEHCPLSTVYEHYREFFFLDITTISLVTKTIHKLGSCGSEMFHWRYI